VPEVDLHRIEADRFHEGCGLAKQTHQAIDVGVLHRSRKGEADGNAAHVEHA